MKFVRYAKPTLRPITLADALAHLRLESSELDAQILQWIDVATEAIERETHTAIMSQTWDCYADSLCETELRHPPVQSITSVAYYDLDSVQQTLSSTVYELGQRNGIGVMRLKYDQDWPSHRCHEDDVRIRYVCGYATAADVPAAIVHAVKLIVANCYEHPEPVNVGNIVNRLPYTIDMLLAGEQMGGVG